MRFVILSSTFFGGADVQAYKDIIKTLMSPVEKQIMYVQVDIILTNWYICDIFLLFHVPFLNIWDSTILVIQKYQIEEVRYKIISAHTCVHSCVTNYYCHEIIGKILIL